LLTRVLERLDIVAPDLVVTLIEGGSDTLLPALARNELDLVLGRLTRDFHTPQFTSDALYDEPVRLVAGRHHPLIARGRIVFGDLAGARWLLPPELAPLRNELEAMLTSRGMHRPIPKIETMSLLLMQIMLGKSDMIAAMPLHVASHYQEQGLLAVIDLDVPIVMPPVGMMLRAGVEQPPAAQVVIDAVREVARGMLPSRTT
jgi:DNA-binding transcriptional LysR family regulator